MTNAEATENARGAMLRAWYAGDQHGELAALEFGFEAGYAAASALLLEAVKAAIEATAKKACHGCAMGEPFSGEHEWGWDYHIWNYEGQPRA